MKREKNRPGIVGVTIKKEEDGLEVEIGHFPSNLPFYDLTRLDWGRIERLMYGDEPNLRVYLTGPEDPVIEQLADFLSSPIKEVIIGRNDADPRLSSSHLSMCAKLLGSSTMNKLVFNYPIIDDTTAPLIISVASRVANHLRFRFSNLQIIDPAEFVRALFSSSFAHLRIFNTRSYLFFGLDLTFWESFLNEHLSNGSFE
ncbi:hypothetical protein PMAYCL1PPCAC_27925, partial [Pristionchus mayeri]